MRDERAAGREDRGGARVEEAPKRLLLEPLEIGLAVHLEDRGQRHAGLARDELVELDEGKLELLGQLGADRRFARAAEAEEGDDAPARRPLLGRWPRCFGFLEQIAQGDTERFGHVLEACDRDIAAAAFELHEEARAHPGALGQLTDREDVPRPLLADGAP